MTLDEDYDICEAFYEKHHASLKQNKKQKFNQTQAKNNNSKKAKTNHNYSLQNNLSFDKPKHVEPQNFHFETSINESFQNSLSSASISSPSSNESFHPHFQAKPAVSFGICSTHLKPNSIKSDSSSISQNYSILAHEISKYSDVKVKSPSCSPRSLNKEKLNSSMNNSLDGLNNDSFSDFSFNSIGVGMSFSSGVSNNTR